MLPFGFTLDAMSHLKSLVMAFISFRRSLCFSHVRCHVYSRFFLLAYGHFISLLSRQANALFTMKALLYVGGSSVGHFLSWRWLFTSSVAITSMLSYHSSSFIFAHIKYSLVIIALSFHYAFFSFRTKHFLIAWFNDKKIDIWPPLLDYRRAIIMPLRITMTAL